jgi:DNA ligase-1
MNELSFPKLIKENRYWEIIVTEIDNNTISVKTRYGINGGKITETKPQTFQKSKGLTFVKKKITDKIRNGYKPENGKEIKNKQVKLFIKPMSAILLEGNENKIVFPAYVQPKLDGFRGVVIKSSSGKVSIVSRNGLPYPHLEKIKKELESFPLIKQGYNLDGELYIHGVSIGELRSVLGRKELNSQKVINIEKNIKYYIFDFFKNKEEIPFEKRLLTLQEAFKLWKSPQAHLVHLIETKTVKSLNDVETLRNQFIENGYEGIIVRNKNGIYLSGKKSSDVFRSKDFKTGNFKIIGANEGKGNNKGTVIWELQCLNTKKTFTAKPIGTKEERTELYKNRTKYIGLKIPIKYYEIDNTTGCVTRHPVALKIKV